MTFLKIQKANLKTLGQKLLRITSQFYFHLFHNRNRFTEINST